jgi:glyoxylase-like metal-dependent hydrolase (beta-lactamase superfamily II)
MIRRFFFPGLLNTGPVCGPILAIRDGFINVYVLKTTDGLVCFDAGWRLAMVARGFEALGLNPRDVAVVFLTHLHWDHARSAGLFCNAEVFVGKHEIPAKIPKWLKPVKRLTGVTEGQRLTAAGISVRILETPGHTSGSVSYLAGERFLFSGDVIRLRQGEAFPFPFWFNRDSRALAQSVRKLAGLNGIECLMTAHNGFTTDVAHAFRHWREPAVDRLRQEESRA